MRYSLNLFSNTCTHLYPGSCLLSVLNSNTKWSIFGMLVKYNALHVVEITSFIGKKITCNLVLNLNCETWIHLLLLGQN